MTKTTTRKPLSADRRKALQNRMSDRLKAARSAYARLGGDPAALERQLSAKHGRQVPAGVLRQRLEQAVVELAGSQTAPNSTASSASTVSASAHVTVKPASGPSPEAALREFRRLSSENLQQAQNYLRAHREAILAAHVERHKGLTGINRTRASIQRQLIENLAVEPAPAPTAGAVGTLEEWRATAWKHGKAAGERYAREHKASIMGELEEQIAATTGTEKVRLVLEKQTLNKL